MTFWQVFRFVVDVLGVLTLSALVTTIVAVLADIIIVYINTYKDSRKNDRP